MSWFIIESVATGAVLAPFDPLPAGALRFRLGRGWGVLRCNNAAAREESADRERNTWIVMPHGRFEIVLSRVGGPECSLSFDHVLVVVADGGAADDGAVGELSSRPEVPDVEADSRPSVPHVEDPAPAVYEDPPPAGGWSPREVALRMFADPASAARLVSLASRAETCCTRMHVLLHALGSEPMREAEGLVEVIAAVGEVVKETGAVPDWISDPRAARAQREIYRETLARTGRGAVSTASPPTMPTLLDGLTGWLPAPLPRAGDEPEAALEALTRELEILTATLTPLARAAAAMASDASLLGDVREALRARTAIRALGTRTD